ncbi:HAD family hydrolase [Roseovarius bejariae]|uniref:HAD family hydrolase n=1 Tax=Roseovarius bejariae TaxID=2576383 RepID=UPI001C553974
MLGNARTLIFDCDGVVLDSNRLKTEAFYTAARPYGDAAARALVEYHVSNGGVSRYIKFAHFLKYILPECPGAETGPDLEGLLSVYSDTVRTGLMTCPVADRLEELRAATQKACWMMVSGGDQSELREVFAARNIDGYFDGGIFGSPETKNEIIARETEAGTIRRPAVFLGDSRLDYEVARWAELDFVFVEGWSEWQEGARMASEGRFAMVRTLPEFLEV